MRSRVRGTSNESDRVLYANVSVHPSWDPRQGGSFEQFLADLGERPAGTTLDRIDVNGNYEPGNVRWATAVEQQNNKRNNRRITFNGCTMTLAQWSREVGIKMCTISDRLERGWSVEDALTKPPRQMAAK